MDQGGLVVSTTNGLPDFSPKGLEVYDAICAVQPGDSRIELFGRRAARAITRSQLGALPRGSGALESFVLCGTNFSSIPLLVRTLAESWLGKPWDKSYPFTYVDCSAFSMPYPGMLQQLIGPAQHDASGFYSPPLFQNIHLPAFKSRSAGNLKLLQEWHEDYLERKRFKFAEMGAGAQAFNQRFRVLVSEQWEKFRDEDEKENGPFGSVIFFDGADRAAQPLREIILQILNNGSLTLASGSVVDFSSSIVILSVYWEDKLFRQTGLGFQPGQPAGKDGGFQAHYQKIRGKLLIDAASSSLVRGVAENLILVSERTVESQKRRVRQALEACAANFDRRGVSVSFTDAFVEGFAEDAQEYTGEKSGSGMVYTEERITSGIRRHVLDPLCRHLLFTEVRSGAKVVFDREDSASFSSSVTVEDPGQGNVVKASDIGEAKANFTMPATIPEWLKTLDSRVRDLFDRAKLA